MRATLLASATATTERFAFEKLCEPRIFLRLVARVQQHCAGSRPPEFVANSDRPVFEIGPSFCLPPVEVSRGTSPIQAAKARPNPKTFGSGTVRYEIAVAPIRPSSRCLFEPLAPPRSSGAAP